MRPIRPLFRNNGRLGTPQCHGTFQEWIGDPSRGKNKPPLDVNRGTLRTELIERPDGSGPIFVGRPILDPSSVPGIIACARERKELTAKEVETLRAFLVETIREKTYREWLASSGLAYFFREDDWNEQDNHRKFALYVLACFVDFFRPGQIDWRTPNTSDMQLVAKLLNVFADLILGDELGEGKFKGPGERDAIMTTWHESDSLEDALDFFVNWAIPTDGFVENSNCWLAVSVNNPKWAETLKQRLR